MGIYSRRLVVHTPNSSLADHGILSLNSVPVKHGQNSRLIKMVPFNLATTLLAGLQGSMRACQGIYLLDAAGSPEPSQHLTMLAKLWCCAGPAVAPTGQTLWPLDTPKNSMSLTKLGYWPYVHMFGPYF